MAAVESEWIISPGQWEEESSVKWRTGLLFIVMISILVLFSMPLDLLPLGIGGLQLPAESASVEAVLRVCNYLRSWISPPSMYVVLNVVIVIIGIKAGILRSSNIGENCSPCIRVHFDKSPSASSAKEDLDLQSPATEIERPIADNYDRIQKLESPPSLISRKPIPKAQRESFLTKEYATNNVDLATAGISVGCRIVESPPSKPHKANDIVSEGCPSSSCLFFIEVSDGKVDTDQSDENKDLSDDELYVKAETFIGNFYHQLKMQREDSWKQIYRIHTESC